VSKADWKHSEEKFKNIHDAGTWKERDLDERYFAIDLQQFSNAPIFSHGVYTSLNCHPIRDVEIVLPLDGSGT